MKKILILSSIILWIWIIPQTYADTLTSPTVKLTPPSLNIVIKENEKKAKELTRKKPNPIKSKSWSANVALTYRTFSTGNAVILSRYDNADLWVQEINIASWAHMSSELSLGWYDETSGEPLFQKRKLSDIVISQWKKPYSVINGQFFDPRKELTPLSFGVKSDWVVRTAWADNRDESKNILIISQTGAQIVPYSWDNLRDAPGYLALVSLSLDTPQQPRESIGRTYICLKTPTTDNTSTTLITFTALAMSEIILEKELPRWGCTRTGTSKLDASGSTRLWVWWEYIYGKARKWDPDYRKIPHYITVWDR